MNPHDQALELIQRYADGLASAEETRRLADLLRADAVLRERFLEYLNVDLALEEYAANGEGNALAAVEACRSVPRRQWRRMLGLTAAAALIVMVTVWSLRKVPLREVDRSSASLVAVEVLAADQVQWVGPSPSIAIGTRSELHRVHLAQGNLTLRLDSGVVLEFRGPTDGSFESPMRLLLVKGQLNADVGERGRGFTVITAAGEVVDLGTRFAVEASDDGETKAAVFSGQVRIDSVNNAGHRDESWSLFAGEAVRFHKREKPRRLRSLFLSRSGTSQANARQSSIIRSVSDNVLDSDFHRFYGVVPAGMAEGASAYTDNHNQRWWAVRGAAFPAELKGADLICPFQSDRHALDLNVTVVLSAPAVVYVMHDVRKPPPGWLAKDFADTGMRLRSGPWPPKGKVVQNVPLDETGQCFLQYSVWRKEVSVAGPVELGPPHLRGQGGPSAMYGIAVKPLARAR